jgi:hypothetical protein
LESLESGITICAAGSLNCHAVLWEDEALHVKTDGDLPRVPEVETSVLSLSSDPPMAMASPRLLDIGVPGCVGQRCMQQGLERCKIDRGKKCSPDDWAVPRLLQAAPTLDSRQHAVDSTSGCDEPHW